MKHLAISIVLSLAATTTAATAAAAQQSYESTPPLQDIDRQPYVQAISDLHNYYILSPQAGGDLPTRTNERNRRIRTLFDRIAQERRPLYVAHRWKQSEHIKCKLSSHSGGTKRCPAELRWPAGYVVIPESMGDTHQHFKEGPAVSGSVIRAVLGRAGRGTNEGDFWGSAKLADAEIDRRVEADRQALRAELTARALPTDRAIDMEPR